VRFRTPKHVEIRQATSGDARFLARNLRATDRKEIRAFTGKDPEEMVRDSFDLSCVAWTIWLSGAPAVLSGLVERSPGVGIPWLVGTESLDFSLEVKRALAMNSKEILADYHAKTGFLYNFISEDNMFTVGWLDWLGFEICSGWGIRNGVPFAYVWRKAEEEAEG